MRKPIIRRTIDIAIATLGLAFFGAPIIAMATVARLESGKSGLFRQTRYGLHGKPFTIYKIRSLNADFDPLPISGIFRKYGLDELPQFFNLMRGDMSIIGPRPHTTIPDVPGWDRILEVPPGLVGLSTVIEKAAGSECTPRKRVKLDTQYVDRRLSPQSALPLDLLIIFKTAKIVFTGRADAGKTIAPTPHSEFDSSGIRELRKLRR